VSREHSLHASSSIVYFGPRDATVDDPESRLRRHECVTRAENVGRAVPGGCASTSARCAFLRGQSIGGFGSDCDTNDDGKSAGELYRVDGVCSVRASWVRRFSASIATLGDCETAALLHHDVQRVRVQRSLPRNTHKVTNHPGPDARQKSLTLRPNSRSYSGQRSRAPNKLLVTPDSSTRRASKAVSKAVRIPLCVAKPFRFSPIPTQTTKPLLRTVRSTVSLR
jgi:hypothetical protein